MASKSSTAVLPQMAPFPSADWREHLMPEEWEACLDAWITIADAHLSLSNTAFSQSSSKDESMSTFLSSYVGELSNHAGTGDSEKARTLRKKSYLLLLRIFSGVVVQQELLKWNFITNVAKAYGRVNGARLLGVAWKKHASEIEASLGNLKSALIRNLDAGLKGDLKSTETQLKRLNHLLHVSPDAAAFFMAGSDFLDSLVTCYKLMNPPLRKAILSTTYLCLIGLTEEEKPRISMLVDQLYSLQSAAETHRAGPTNANDSLAANLVSQTPILRQIQLKLGSSEQARAKAVITQLETFKIPGVSMRPPQRILNKRAEKGKGKAVDNGDHNGYNQIHVHRMSLVTQVQDLFPDLGSGFTVKLLDEFDDNVETIISHLLEDSLPSHLQGADRSEVLPPTQQSQEHPEPDLAPHYVPYEPPARRNKYDGDEFDRLAVDASRLHIGARNVNRTADDILEDRTSAPNKSAILSALAAFDSDDDERDDTYDIEDVGGTVDSAVPGSNPEERSLDVKETFDETLFKAYKATPEVFGRDAETRRGKARISLREETGMTDEAIEGWSLMLSRDPKRLRKLDAQFSAYHGGQRELASTSWKASPAGSGTEDSDMDGGGRGRGGSRGRRGGGAGRGRGRGGNVAGPTGDKETEQARQRKAANKGSSANHNRRDQRAKKMARGGFAA